MSPEIKKELEKMRGKIPPNFLFNIVRSLYFQTAWELPKNLFEAGVNKDLIWNLQLEIAKKTGIQGANSIKGFQFSGSELEKLVKYFMFAALNMGVNSSVIFVNPEECELIFKKNCGHGLKIKEYGLPFTCSEWCKEHFSAELHALNPHFIIKLLEGLPQGKKFCKFKIFKL
ncbi:MAG: hypothetical protein EAX96_19290 [Candidatus Lokiarchaeota archaeon]|nr:hypothetical protein [Candidatus Lokiarchaeota archaeon]